MTKRARTVTTLLALAASLALPATAWAHAALLHTVPSASGVVNSPPAQVELTYSEAVEPRFAIVSITDAGGNQQASGPPRRSATDPDTLVVPLRHLAQGWYLVYWRVISVDGHPVRGAFTFAVGPNPGPAPQFVIPSTSETAATTPLLIARWITFLAVMSAIGIFVLRMLIARPLVRRVRDTELRWVSIAFMVAAGVALVATPIYLLLATAKFALRSAFALGAIVPLVRVSAFGRGLVDLELCFVLFVVAALATIWVDRPDRPQRSVAELLSITGALVAAAAVLVIPGLAGHAAQTSPRGWALLFDWAHLVTGSIWIGGLIGLLVLWRSLPVARRVAGLIVCVPRFSNVAFVSVNLLIVSGVAAAVLHLPTLASLWQTSYGKTILVKVALLFAAMLLAAVNLLRTKPRLAASATLPELGTPTSILLRRLVAAEIVIVSAAIFAAALLSSLPPPSKALAAAGKASARVGPGPVTEVVTRNGYRLEFRIDPNRAAMPNEFSVRITRDGAPVRGADVTTSVAMLDMEMGAQAYHLSETAPGVYSHSAPALVMVGHWGLSFDVRPPGSSPFTVVLVDRANG
jgi:copper transport protein